MKGIFAFLFTAIKWVFRTLWWVVKTTTFLVWKVVVRPILTVLAGRFWIWVIRKTWWIFLLLTLFVLAF